jgi:hypothetical protein
LNGFDHLHARKDCVMAQNLNKQQSCLLAEYRNRFDGRGNLMAIASESRTAGGFGYSNNDLDDIDVDAVALRPLAATMPLGLPSELQNIPVPYIGPKLAVSAGIDFA